MKHRSLSYLSNEGDSYAGVRSDESHKNLGADVSQKVFYVLPDEMVLHDGLSAWDVCM